MIGAHRVEDAGLAVVRDELVFRVIRRHPIRHPDDQPVPREIISRLLERPRLFTRRHSDRQPPHQQLVIVDLQRNVLQKVRERLGPPGDEGLAAGLPERLVSQQPPLRRPRVVSDQLLFESRDSGGHWPLLRSPSRKPRPWSDQVMLSRGRPHTASSSLTKYRQPLLSSICLAMRAAMFMWDEEPGGRARHGEGKRAVQATLRGGLVSGRFDPERTVARSGSLDALAATAAALSGS